MVDVNLAIVGFAMIAGPNSSYEMGHSALQLEAEAVRLAIEDAGLEPKDIDGCINTRGGPRSGHGNVDPPDSYPRMLGLPINFFYRVGRGGGLSSLALVTARSFLQLGLANAVVISGSFDNWSRTQTARSSGWKGQVRAETASKDWGAWVGETGAVSSHALLATRYRERFGLDEEHLGSVAVQTRRWANMNPLARMYEKPMSMDDYLSSPFLVWPYRKADMSVTSDGAVACVVTLADRAAGGPKPPVNVLGVGTAEASRDLWWENRQYDELPIARARDTAFSMAGLSLADVDMIQLYDCFTMEVILQLEGYGFCGPGEGGQLAAEGHLGPGGSLPCNTGGGLLSSYHFADLTGFAEAIVQLRGEAGERQVDRPSVALVAANGGDLLSPGLCPMHTTLLLGVG